MNRRAASGLMLSLLALAQDPAFKFEVASIRMSAHAADEIGAMRGGPGTSEPERIDYSDVPFGVLLRRAYGLPGDQIVGPNWISQNSYTVVAKVPPGTTPEQLMLMWQNLLADRFHLQTHFIKKDITIYQLIAVKPKLHKSGAGPAEPGFPEPFAGQKWGFSRVPPRNIRMTFRDASMADLIDQLKWPLGTAIGTNGISFARITDGTGLAGRCDFTLEYAGRHGPGGAFPPPLPQGETDTAPLLIDALREQLGLRLVEKKAPLDVLVVDHADRIPTEN
jgi:uncharacterized protein (TIGR03435 family)